MPRQSPYDIKLSKAERAESLERSRRYTSRYRDVIRAKIVLLASEGMANDAIAARLDTPRQIVSKWRRRFHLQRLAGLEEQPRAARTRPKRFRPAYLPRTSSCAKGGTRWASSSTIKASTPSRPA
jgi:transposase